MKIQLIRVLIAMAAFGFIPFGYAQSSTKEIYNTTLKDVAAITKAAKSGDAEAQYELGDMYDFGESVPKDKIKAREWYEKSAYQGNSDAQLNLGYIYYFFGSSAYGVNRNLVTAFNWFMKSAEQGHGLAQVFVGLLYEKGEGVSQSLVKAKEWFGKACDNGEQDGCLYYGRIN